MHNIPRQGVLTEMMTILTPPKSAIDHFSLYHLTIPHTPFPTCNPQLYNQHAVPKHIKLISTHLHNLIIATHHEILAHEGGRQHDMAGPRPVKVRQQHIYDFQPETWINVEIRLTRLGFHRGFGFFVNRKRLQSPHDGRSDGDDTASLFPCPVDLCRALVVNFQVFGSDLVIFDFFCADVADGVGLSCSYVQCDVGHFYPL